MSDFIPGQRWINYADIQLGLGTVLAVDFRTVRVLFISTGETRTYAQQTAPLTRVAFAPGDWVRSHEDWSLKVESVRKQDGLLTYIGKSDDGQPAELAEGQLDSFTPLNRPAERLFTGQIDRDKWFELRYQTLEARSRLAHSDLRGLTGGRTTLIPHQLYIAHEVANRYAPRVLLADEVGLGKTIEAGLILHQQLLTERAKRILIVVPEGLVHQWLVEMLRRFNLHFSIFDEQRCRAIEESTGQDNVFHTEQLVLCSLEFLTKETQRFAQALDGNWDLLVVDEAHHLEWSAHQASQEYQRIEKLAAETKGVLLLTATPEQLGKESHFARLRLLDPNRFGDLDRFIAEEQSYEPFAAAIEALLSHQPPDAQVLATVAGTLAEGDNQHLLDVLQRTDTDEAERNAATNDLVEHLLDRHGTGRVLFRNTRSAVEGFPGRKLIPYPLPLPAEYAECLADFQTSGTSEPRLLLCPEHLYQASDYQQRTPWTEIDPRIDWLGNQLKQLRPAKALVITATARTAIDVADALRNQIGLHAAVFHEGMSILERDRAAAFFSDTEYGSQALVCSEIGSEGRNFQFAQHLILLDLPLNPDLLEQRIGRLDRIGQSETVQIHVPYLENSAQAVMFQWFHQGLNAFENTCPAGHSVFVQVESSLVEALHQIDDGIEDLPNLISMTNALHHQLSDALERGRDRLLEFNSCRPHVAQLLHDRAVTLDAESNPLSYLENVFDCYGIDSEDHSQGSYIVRPGAHMRTSSFPGLREDGMTITCDRDTALANDDMQFVTWEHPLATGAMDLVLGNEQGNAAVTVLKYPGVKPGTLLLECLYVLESVSDASLQSSRYLPPSTIRVLVDKHGKNYDALLTPEIIQQSRQAPPAVETIRKIVRTYAEPLRQLLAVGKELAQQRVPEILAAAHELANHTLVGEIDRLKALHLVNPNVRDEEIRYFETQRDDLNNAFKSANLRLDALRVIILT